MPVTIVAIMIILPMIKSTNIVMTNFVLMKLHAGTSDDADLATQI